VVRSPGVGRGSAPRACGSGRIGKDQTGTSAGREHPAGEQQPLRERRNGHVAGPAIHCPHRWEPGAAGGADQAGHGPVLPQNDAGSTEDRDDEVPVAVVDEVDRSTGTRKPGIGRGASARRRGRRNQPERSGGAGCRRRGDRGAGRRPRRRREAWCGSGGSRRGREDGSGDEPEHVPFHKKTPVSWELDHRRVLDRAFVSLSRRLTHRIRRGWE